MSETSPNEGIENPGHLSPYERIAALVRSVINLDSDVSQTPAETLQEALSAFNVMENGKNLIFRRRRDGYIIPTT